MAPSLALRGRRTGRSGALFPGLRENFPALADLIPCSARPGIRLRTGSAPRVFAQLERLIAPEIDQIPCIFPWNREFAGERSSLQTGSSAIKS